MDRSGDRILLEGMVFHGYVGVHDFEKANGQPFLIDIALICPRLLACDTDQLDQTIDYAQAFDVVQSTVKTARCDLIERLAGLIAEKLLAAFSLAEAVDVTVRKPQAPIQGDFSAMGVRILRERA